MNVTELAFAVVRCEMENSLLDEQTKNCINAESQARLYQLLGAHDLSHLLSDALLRNEIFVDGGKGKKWLQHHRNRAVCRYEQMQYEIDAIVRAFENAEIPHVLLKGAVLRDAYPQVWFRTSCDVDILVQESDLLRAGDALCEIGYAQGTKGSHDVRFVATGGVNLELHYSLIEEAVNPDASRILQGVWENVVLRDGFGYSYVMNDEFFYFYHVAHMAKHFSNGGCGVRSVLDLYVLNGWQNARREELLRRGGLSAFENALRALACVWFAEKGHDGYTKEIADYILRGGAYGVMENRVVIQQTKKGGKFRYALSRIFLPYETLRFYYPSLQNRKWLTPLYQIRRWGRLIFGGGMKRSLKELQTNGSVSKEKREHAATLLERLGI